MLDGRDMCLGNPKREIGMVGHFTSKKKASPRLCCGAWVRWRAGLGKETSAVLLVLVRRGMGLPVVVRGVDTIKVVYIPGLFRAFSYIQEGLGEGENTRKNNQGISIGSGKI